MLKAYRNLWRNKKSRYIIIGIILIVGMIPLIMNMSKLHRLESKGMIPPSIMSDHPIIGFLTYTEWDLVVVGIVLIYIAVILIPKCSVYAQDPSDYYAEVNKNTVFIKYKDYEFELLKKDFKFKNMYFRDKNNKFVAISTAYQIYKFINQEYDDVINKSN